MTDHGKTEIPAAPNEERRVEERRKVSVIPSATPEQVLKAIDIKKKKWTPLPLFVIEETTAESGTISKRYKVRKQTVSALVELSKMFFKEHTEELEEALKLMDDPLGRRPLKEGEEKWYNIATKTKGTIVLPVRYIHNYNLSNGRGWAIATHHGDHIKVRLATKEEIEKRYKEGLLEARRKRSDRRVEEKEDG